MPNKWLAANHPAGVFSMMGYRRFDTLTDIANKGYWLALECSCGHVAKHNPMVVFELLARRGASTRLTQLNQAMKCGKCGGKDFVARHCEGPAIWSG